MTSYDPPSAHVAPLREIPHYHGDAVRALLVVAAVLLLVGAGMGAALPLPAIGLVAVAIILVLSAGITNPVQIWIHWVNALLSAAGTLLFGSAALGNYRSGAGLTDPTSFTFTLALALVSLVALYLATRTIRGLMLRESH